jgi:hypothetical protein
MRSLDRPYDAVSREKIILDIYALVDPLDAWRNNSTVLFDPDPLWVDSIDPDVIALQWFIDGVLVPSAHQEMFDPQAYGLLSGLHTITARAYDPTGFDVRNGWVRLSQSSLEQNVSWRIMVGASQVPEPGALALLVTGLLTAVVAGRGRRRDLDRLNSRGSSQRRHSWIGVITSFIIVSMIG